MVLTASVSFLALPGLDPAGRSAGFVATLGSIASLASSAVAWFRNSAEMQRLAIRGGEGQYMTMVGVNVSNTSVLLFFINMTNA